MKTWQDFAAELAKRLAAGDDAPLPEIEPGRPALLAPGEIPADVRFWSPEYGLVVMEGSAYGANAHWDHEEVEGISVPWQLIRTLRRARPFVRYGASARLPDWRPGDAGLLWACQDRRILDHFSVVLTALNLEKRTVEFQASGPFVVTSDKLGAR